MLVAWKSNAPLPHNPKLCFVVPYRHKTGIYWNAIGWLDVTISFHGNCRDPRFDVSETLLCHAIGKSKCLDSTSPKLIQIGQFLPQTVCMCAGVFTHLWPWCFISRPELTAFTQKKSLGWLPYKLQEDQGEKCNAMYFSGIHFRHNPLRDSFNGCSLLADIELLFLRGMSSLRENKAEPSLFLILCHFSFCSDPLKCSPWSTRSLFFLMKRPFLPSEILLLLSSPFPRKNMVETCDDFRDGSFLTLNYPVLRVGETRHGSTSR